MTKPLRIGIIGGGVNSAIGASHLSAIRMDGKYEIVGSLFSRSEEKNLLSHQKYGIPWSGHSDTLETWLEENTGNFDLLAVLTPSTDHSRHIKEIISHGISFITEKPVGCGLTEVLDIKNTLNRNRGIVARFVHNYSGYPMFREMVLRLSSGRIGKIHSVRVQMPSDGFARERIIGKPQIWRQSDPEVPMIMLDLGTHMHHLVTMLLGKSSSRVKARMHCLVNGLGVVDNAEIWEERSDGICVSYWMSKAHLGPKNGLRIEVYGNDGSLIWHQMDPDHLIEIDINSNQTLVNRGSISPEASNRDRFKPGHPTGFVEAFANFYSDLADDFHFDSANTARSRWICPIEDAFDGIHFLQAAANSYQNGQWIEI